MPSSTFSDMEERVESFDVHIQFSRHCWAIVMAKTGPQSSRCVPYTKWILPCGADWEAEVELGAES
jgi:hypothetical protein